MKLKRLFNCIFCNFVLLAIISIANHAAAEVETTAIQIAAETDGPKTDAKDVWLTDINAIDKLLRQYHPDPFFRTGEGAWLEGLAMAHNLINDGASDATITAQLMSAVAHLKDGHTRLEPVEIDAFANWLPLRFYEFEEGFYVTVAAKQYADLIGKRLISISGISVKEVWQEVAVTISGDNAFQVKEGAAALLSNAGLLSAKEIIDKPTDPVTLVFEDDKGNQLVR